MRRYFSIIIFLSIPFGLFAQGESDWWYFGNYAGIHFTDDTVEAVYNGAMETHLGNTTQSDENGNLLFYTNGGVIYNNNHEIMENGNWDPPPSPSTALSLKPDQNENKYFFVNGNFLNSDWPEYWYGEINMDANAGLGSVITHTFLQDSLLPYLTSSRKNNGEDYWIVFRKPMSNTYMSFLLTESGIEINNPVLSNTGDLFLVEDSEFWWGNILINPQGNLLTFTHVNQIIDGQTISNGKLELFHFDSETGTVGDRIIRLDETNAPYVNIAGTDSSFSGYGLAFSADGEKLYFTQAALVFQCNISILDSTFIQQSLVQFNTYVNPFNLMGMQLAKDGRLYIASGNGISSLAAIHHPNVAGLDAGFELVSIDLGSNNYSKRDLPNFDPSLFSSGFTVSNRCINTETVFSLLYDMPYSYVHWEFGDGATSIEWEPSHTYSSIGTYTVNLTTVVGEDTTNKSMEVIIEDVPSVDLGLDSALFCGGDTLLLDAYNYASYYTWQDSSYQSTFEVSEEGNYYVQVKNICGQASDTVTYVLDRDNVHLGEDTLICIQEPLYLLVDQPSATSWLWQDGSTLPYYEADIPGDYFVFVTTPCQFIYDSISVYTEDCSLFAPNIITPNGDGVNDYFVIINIEMLDYNWSLAIYNRWGKQVYFSENYQNDWNADKLSDGVYFYILRSAYTTTSYKGSVTVIRD